MIYIAADNHGFRAIKFVEEYLKSKDLEYSNLGVKTNEEHIKLEEMLPPIAEKILETNGNVGIISCGTGIGIEVGINKFSGIRAALATNEKIAEWAKVYDNCNVICIVGWDADKEKISRMLDAYFATDYDGSEKRLKMFEEFNKWH